MPNRFERYRVKDGVTTLSERYFNPVLQDIDLRLANLEEVRIAWEEAVAVVTNFGLVRINEVLGPAFEDVAVKAAEVEQLRQDALAALAELQTAVAHIASDVDADLAAWKSQRLAELEAWRTSLTASLPQIDARLGALELGKQARSDVLDGWSTKALPSGEVVGSTDVQTLTHKTLAGGMELRLALSGTVIDLQAANYFNKTITGHTTLSLANVPPADTVASFVLELTNGGAYTVGWWSGVKWVGGTAPTLTAVGRDVLAFYSHDAGVNWTGLVLGKDVK